MKWFEKWRDTFPMMAKEEPIKICRESTLMLNVAEILILKIIHPENICFQVLPEGTSKYCSLQREI